MLLSFTTGDSLPINFSFQWEMGIDVDVTLPPGTYWLQVQNVVTRWGTWAYWGEKNGIGCSPLVLACSLRHFDALVYYAVSRRIRVI